MGCALICPVQEAFKTYLLFLSVMPIKDRTRCGSPHNLSLQAALKTLIIHLTSSDRVLYFGLILLSKYHFVF